MRLHNQLHCPNHVDKKKDIPLQCLHPHHPHPMRSWVSASAEKTHVFYPRNCKTASMMTLFLETTVLELGGSCKTTSI